MCVQNLFISFLGCESTSTIAVEIEERKIVQVCLFYDDVSDQPPKNRKAMLLLDHPNQVLALVTQMFSSRATIWYYEQKKL